ncbi:MAG: hypothetical protein ACF8MJ_13915 [Phycisphaerales bacterium JB050]
MPWVLGAFPAPPLSDRLLFESPIVVPLVVLMAAIGIGYGLGRAAKAREGWIVMGLGLAAAFGIAISARVVETDREAIRSGTRDFVDAMVEGDGSRVERLLASRLTLASDGSSVPLNAREYILDSMDMVSGAIQRYSVGIQGAGITAPSAGKTQFVVRVLQSTEFGAGLATFVFDWQETPGIGWQINAIDLVAINGSPPYREVFRYAR